MPTGVGVGASHVFIPYNRAGGGTVIPTDFANLLIWYDASDPSTLFTDAGKTAPVVADGDPVYVVENKANPGTYDASQATLGNRFDYRTAVQNGLSIVRGNGVSKYYNIPGFSSVSSNYTCLIISRQSDTTETFDIYFDSQTTRLFFSYPTTPASTLGYFTVATIVTVPYSNITFFLGTFVLEATNQGRILADNVEQANSLTFAQQALGGNVTLGARNDGANHWFGGDIGEFVLYNRALTLSEYSQLGNSLITKWGI